jgi:Cyclic nucleotide-binding domain
LQQRVRLAGTRALVIVGCGTHRKTLRRVRGLLDARTPQRAYAIELLEVSVEQEVRRRLLPLVVGDVQHSSAMISALTPALGAGVEAAHNSRSGDIRSKQLGGATGIETVRRAISHVVIERLIVLRGVDVFAGATPDLPVDIARMLEDVTLEPYEHLFEEGDTGSDMYVVVSGTMAIHRENRLFAHSGQSEVIGDLALLDGEPRSATVIAETPARLYRLDAESFFELMGERPEVLRAILHTVIGRLRLRMHEVAVLES